MRILAGFMTVTCLLVAQPTELRAWGGEGHRIVAAIALKLLPADKADAIDKVLRELHRQSGND